MIDQKPMTDAEMADKLENSFKTTAPLVPAMCKLIPVVLETIAHLRKNAKDKEHFYAR